MTCNCFHFFLPKSYRFSNQYTRLISVFFSYIRYQSYRISLKWSITFFLNLSSSDICAAKASWTQNFCLSSLAASPQVILFASFSAENLINVAFVLRRCSDRSLANMKNDMVTYNLFLLLYVNNLLVIYWKKLVKTCIIYLHG